MAITHSSSDRSARIHQLSKARAGLVSCKNDPPEPFHQSRFGSRSSAIVRGVKPVYDLSELVTLFKRRVLVRSAPARSTGDAKKADGLPNAPANVVLDLPINRYKEHIQAAVRDSDVSVIRGRTGSGKSIQVAKFLSKMFDQVIVLEPRRVLVESLAKFRSELDGTVVGQEVGHQHSQSIMRSDNSKIVYVTYGSQLVSELLKESGRNRIFVFDEFHEQAAEMDILMGLLRRRGIGGDRPKVVLMSATLDPERLKDTFGEVPFVDVEGRTFPITRRDPLPFIQDDIIAAIGRGKTPLVFVYGKQPISKTIADITDGCSDLTAIPFHAQLSKQELRRPFEPFVGNTVVVASNIAESGLTMKINCVVMSGYIRRLELIDGVPSLMVRPITKFDLEQQEGRAGRVEPGESIYRGPPIEDLSLMPPPEIQNTRIDALYLKVVSGGENFRAVARLALNRPSLSQIESAERRLRVLGLISSNKSTIPTKMGSYVANLPLSPSNGKLVYLAREIDQGIGKFTSSAIDMAAVIQAEGILEKVTKEARRLLGDFGNSEPLGQARLMAIASKVPEDQWSRLGINAVKLHHALDIRKNLRARLGLEPTEFSDEMFTKLDQQNLLECLWKSQIDSVFRRVGGPSRHRGKNGPQVTQGEEAPVYKQLRHREERPPRGVRTLSRETLVDANRFFVGHPFNVGELMRSGENKLHRLLLMPSQVPRKWLENNLPAEFHESFERGLAAERHRTESDKSRERAEETYRPRRRR